MIEALVVLWLDAVVVLATALTLVIGVQAVHRLVRRAIGKSSPRVVEAREPAQAEPAAPPSPDPKSASPA